jgi:16S rRNA (guanine527-N7)-methyltransferase
VTGRPGATEPGAGSGLASAVEEARRRGFFGPRPAEDQLAHARAFVRLMDEAGVGPARFLDLGSGGGLPGLALAEAWSEVTGAFLDSSTRRCAFLRETLSALGWADRIEVLQGRAEELGRRPELRAAFPLVVARSFGSPPVTAEIGGAFLDVGGALVVSEPETERSRWPEAGLVRLGLLVADRRRGPSAGIVILRRRDPVEETWPRAVGIPAKRPLW